MIFHNAGKYDGDETKLPQREHEKNAVPFKEPDAKQLAIWANIGSFILIVILLIPVGIKGRSMLDSAGAFLGMVLPIATLLPHEFLHALCFKEDVYMYNNLKQGMMFVAGAEDMSKGRFIFMSLLPNLIFGLIPYAVYFVTNYIFLGVFGALCIGMGFGDYINVFNALTQMPRESRTYLCGMHSFWYMPDRSGEKKMEKNDEKGH